MTAKKKKEETQAEQTAPEVVAVEAGKSEVKAKQTAPKAKPVLKKLFKFEKVK